MKLVSFVIYRYIDHDDNDTSAISSTILSINLQPNSWKVRMNGKIPVQKTDWRVEGADERENSRSEDGLAGGRCE